MRSVRSGLELWMSLCSNEPWMVGNLDHFHNPSIRRKTTEVQSFFSQCIAVIVVDFVTVTMSFVDGGLAVNSVGFGILVQFTRICAKS